MIGGGTIGRLVGPPIRVGLLDDHEVLLDGMSTWLAENARDLTVTVSSTSWTDFVQDAAFPPQLVLLDYRLAKSVSIEVRVRTCVAAGAAVIVLASLDSDDARSRSMSAGASLFLTKDVPMAVVLELARQLLRGGMTAGGGC